MIHFTNSVSLGDLFTGLSVLVSAVGIAFSQAHDRRQHRREARAAVMEVTLQSISEIYENGLILSEKIKWQQVGESEYTDREIIDFGFDLLIKIKILQPRYSIWASNRELNCL